MKKKENEDKSKLSYVLDLMDWKTIERNAQASIDEHKVSIVISEVLLANAEAQIKLRDGKTLKEENAAAKNYSVD